MHSKKMTKQIIELKEKTVNALIELLETHKDKTISIMGAGGPIFIHITDDCVILDEIVLE